MDTNYVKSDNYASTTGSVQVSIERCQKLLEYLKLTQCRLNDLNQHLAKMLQLDHYKREQVIQYNQLIDTEFTNRHLNKSLADACDKLYNVVDKSIPLLSTNQTDAMRTTLETKCKGHTDSYSCAASLLQYVIETLPTFIPSFNLADDHNAFSNDLRAACAEVLEQSIPELDLRYEYLNSLYNNIQKYIGDKHHITPKPKGLDLGFCVTANDCDIPESFVKLYSFIRHPLAYDQWIMLRLFGTNGIEDVTIVPFTENTIALQSNNIDPLGSLDKSRCSLFNIKYVISQKEKAEKYKQLFNIMIKSLVIDAKDLHRSNIVGTKVIDCYGILDDRYTDHEDPFANNFRMRFKRASRDIIYTNKFEQQYQALLANNSIASNIIQRFILSQCLSTTSRYEASTIANHNVNIFSMYGAVDFAEMFKYLEEQRLNNPAYVKNVCRDVLKQMQLIDDSHDTNISVPSYTIERFSKHINNRANLLYKIIKQQPPMLNTVAVHDPVMTSYQTSEALQRNMPQYGIVSKNIARHAHHAQEFATSDVSEVVPTYFAPAPTLTDSSLDLPQAQGITTTDVTFLPAYNFPAAPSKPVTRLKHIPRSKIQHKSNTQNSDMPNTSEMLSRHFITTPTNPLKAAVILVDKQQSPEHVSITPVHARPNILKPIARHKAPSKGYAQKTAIVNPSQVVPVSRLRNLQSNLPQLSNKQNSRSQGAYNSSSILASSGERYEPKPYNKTDVTSTTITGSKLCRDCNCCSIM